MKSVHKLNHLKVSYRGKSFGKPKCSDIAYQLNNKQFFYYFKFVGCLFFIVGVLNTYTIFVGNKVRCSSNYSVPVGAKLLNEVQFFNCKCSVFTLPVLFIYLRPKMLTGIKVALPPTF